GGGRRQRARPASSRLPIAGSPRTGPLHRIADPGPSAGRASEEPGGGTMRQNTKEAVRPMARSEGLVVEQLDGEVLIYDLERHRAHCLNEASALVWRACDGTRPVPELAALIEELVPGWDEDTTNYALAQLEK